MGRLVEVDLGLQREQKRASLVVAGAAQALEAPLEGRFENPFFDALTGDTARHCSRTECGCGAAVGQLAERTACTSAPATRAVGSACVRVQPERAARRARRRGHGALRAALE